MKIHHCSAGDGVVINGDSTSRKTFEEVAKIIVDNVPLICTDPPYGNILKSGKDKTTVTDTEYTQWMWDWTDCWSQFLIPGGAFYVWGGTGRPYFRPFFKYLADLEECVPPMQLANLITWSKRRAYGVQNNYLYTREECAYLVKGDAKKPAKFNVPLLDDKRGYAGYNKLYPAKSEFKRRTNVWCDINEIFRGKVHEAQKKRRLYEIPIEVHTSPGDWVIDPFAGSGVCAHAARKLGRKFVLVEQNKKTFEACVERLEHGKVLP